MRLQMNDLSLKLQEEIARLTAQLEKITAEKSQLHEQVAHAETTAKDFEEMAITLDYKLKDMSASHSEELQTLKQELKLAQSELGQLKGSEEQTKLETTDLAQELDLTKTKLKEVTSKARQLESLVAISQEDKKRLETRLKDAEKDLKESKEALSSRDKDLVEQHSKYHELVMSSSKENERLLKEHHAVLEKLHSELDISKRSVAKLKEELESRQRSESLIMPRTPIKETEEESSPSKPVHSPETTPETPSETVLESKKVAEVVADESETQDEQNDKFFEDAMANGLMGRSDLTNSNPFANSMLRRDTFDNRSVNQSRRNSGLSMNRFAFRMGGRNPDEKLQAELNELKIRLKETNDSSTKRIQELLTELEQKTEQASRLNKELAESKKAAEKAQTSELEVRHREDELQTQIKNLKAELEHVLRENEYCRDSAASSSLKVAQICEDYEKNQVALMKKNKLTVQELKRVRDCVDQVTAVILKEKLKSTGLEGVLKAYRDVNPLV